MKSVVAGKVKRPLMTSKRCSVRAELAEEPSRILGQHEEGQRGLVWHCWITEIETGDEGPRLDVSGHVDSWISWKDHGLGNL